MAESKRDGAIRCHPIAAKLRESARLFWAPPFSEGYGRWRKLSAAALAFAKVSRSEGFPPRSCTCEEIMTAKDVRSACVCFLCGSLSAKPLAIGKKHAHVRCLLQEAGEEVTLAVIVANGTHDSPLGLCCVPEGLLRRVLDQVFTEARKTNGIPWRTNRRAFGT